MGFCFNWITKTLMINEPKLNRISHHRVNPLCKGHFLVVFQDLGAMEIFLLFDNKGQLTYTNLEVNMIRLTLNFCTF